jgi:hypothetical protein
VAFLSPFLLASLAALAVPLWPHLRRRRRQTPVEFPSLRYLKMAARMKRQAKVEDLWLLLLRLLLVALLAAAFARPVVRSGGWLGAGRAVESVIVIDATASMGWRGETGSRLDAAKRLAREWIDGLDRSDAVALWVLTDKLEQPVPVPVPDRAHLFDRLDALKASEGSSSLAPVFNAAREWVETRGAGRKELVVITDNQAAAWDWPAEGFFRNAWKRGDTSLVVLSPDSQQPSNLSVAAVEWEGKAVREGTLLHGVVKLVNHGNSAAGGAGQGPHPVAQRERGPFLGRSSAFSGLRGACPTNGPRQGPLDANRHLGVGRRGVAGSNKLRVGCRMARRR